MDEWKQLLLRLLCRIYREWGGNCDDLYSQPESAPKVVSDEYKVKEAPTFPDSTSLKDFLDTLDDLEMCLNDPKNDLPAADTALLMTMIAGLRKDLGA